MTKYLIVALWPVGLAVIIGGALLLARRPQPSPGAGSGRAGSGRAGSGRAGQHGPARHHTRAGGAPGAMRDAVRGSVQLAVLAAAGAVAVFAIICLLGVGVTHFGPGIDRPVFTWMQGHHVHVMVAAMNRLTKIGDTWTVWGAAVAAAVCLAVTWRGNRWLPPAALGAAIVIDHYTTLALRHVFHRIGPPTSPLGTFPSGGCDRCILFFGLIAYLLWREFSGRRATAILAAAVVAALGFNEAYSRVYLSLHWLTDALSGLVYGTLLLAAFVAAIRLLDGRPRVSQAGQVTAPAQAGAQVSQGHLA